MQRLLELSKFRNLGFDKTDYLVINSNFTKGKLGGVVTLIGQNNAGKSNVLAALEKLSNNYSLDGKDVTYLSFNEKDRKPSLALTYREGENYVKMQKEYGHDHVTYLHNLNDEIKEPSLSVIRKEFSDFEKSIPSELKTNWSHVNEYFKTIADQKSSKDSVIKAAIQLIRLLEDNLRSYYYGTASYSRITTQFNLFKQNSSFYRFVDNQKGDEQKRKKAVCEQFLSQYGVSTNCQIIDYKDTQISEKDLVIDDVNQIKDNRFFASLFKILDIDFQEIVNAYNEYSAHPNIQILKKEENKINGKMKEINKRFNTLYFAESDDYQFGITLETGKILFSMARGKDGDPIMLNSQSTGFRWFFDLYFNFLSTNALRYGDIVVMDEVGSYLHPMGLSELRKFLSEFGKKNGITFVVATHNPFFIDVDNYDELRVVSLKDNKAYIDNLFTAVNDDDPDSLIPIKEALTIKQHMLYDYDVDVTWVEGITDYCYLTMFKKFFKKDNIAFIPFNGVGNSTEETTKVLKKLIKIKLSKRSILVDGDKAGMDMFNQCKGTFLEHSRHNLSELSTGQKTIKTIEDLFSDEDKKKFQSLNIDDDQYKRASFAAYMKNNCQLDDFSKETISNFKKLFELLEQ